MIGSPPGANETPGSSESKSRSASTGPAGPAQQVNDQPQTGFAVYRERRPAGLFGRLLITGRHLLGLLFGGAFAFVRQRKAEGTAGTVEIVLLRAGLIFIWPFMNKQVISQPFPVQFRQRLELLGPTYIKLGQILSLREDLLPIAITDELKNLLDRLPAVPFTRFTELIETDLKRPVDSIFLHIEPTPLGSASLAQTHRAMLRTREVVVIKVLKPGVRHMVERDTMLLRLVGRILQWFLARYQPARLINEFCRYTLREVDLRFEAENAETFAANFRDEPDVRFPQVYRQFSNREVLCMEYFQGLKPDPQVIGRLSRSQKEQLIKLGVGATIRMIFRDGFFHADLHPGNLVIFKNGQVGFLDLGMVGRFDSQMRRRMLYYFYALVTGNPANAARYLTSIARAGQNSDVLGFRRAVEELYQRWLRTPSFHQFSLARVILESVALAGRYRIEYPGEIILMVKALVTIEGVGHLVAPGINVREASQGHVRDIIFEQYNLSQILSDSLLLVPELLDLANRSPLALNESLQALEGRLKQTEPDHFKGIRSALLAGFCLIAATILIAFGGPWLVTTALFLAAILFAARS